jgi:hypothetical protein
MIPLKKTHTHTNKQTKNINKKNPKKPKRQAPNEEA